MWTDCERETEVGRVSGVETSDTQNCSDPIPESQPYTACCSSFSPLSVRATRTSTTLNYYNATVLRNTLHTLGSSSPLRRAHFQKLCIYFC